MADDFVDSFLDPPRRDVSTPPLKPQDPAPEDLDDDPMEPDDPPEGKPPPVHRHQVEHVPTLKQHDWRNDLPEDAPDPMRVALFFTGISVDPEGRDINAIIELIINHASNLGLNFEWGADDVMKYSDVVDGSPLYQAIMERVR